MNDVTEMEDDLMGGANKAARGILLFSGLVLCLVAFTYLTILPTPLVSDDHYFFSPKFSEQPWRFFYSDLLPFDPHAKFFRPLPAIVFCFEQHLPKFLPVLPHTLSLLFHLTNTALVGIVVCRLLRGQRHLAIAVVGSMLFFGLHPQATGAVCWVSARFDLMSVFFGALGLYFWHNEKTPSIRLKMISVIAFICALLSKETAIAFPATVLVWEAGRMAIGNKADITKEQMISIGMLLAATVFYVIFRMACLGGVGGYSNVTFGGIDLESSLGYLIVMLWPFGRMGTTPWLWVYGVSVAMIGVILFAASTTRRPQDQLDHRRKLMDYAWVLPCLLCLSFLVLMGLLPLTVRQILEHTESRNSYGSLFGFAILLGYAIVRLSAIRAGRPLTFGILMLFLAAGLWSQQVEISRWKAAGLRAKSILDQTVQLVPEPAEEILLVMSGIPVADKPSYYVFGMGIEEALQARYDRDDIRVERWPSREMITQPPDNSIVLQYSIENDLMKILKRTDK